MEIGHSRPVDNQTVFECKVRKHLLSFRSYIEYLLVRDRLIVRLPQALEILLHGHEGRFIHECAL